MTRRGLVGFWRRQESPYAKAFIVAGVGALLAGGIIGLTPSLRHAVWQEVLKFNPQVFLILLSLVGSALIGSRISAIWNLRQKQKELDLATARDFHALYGEFFAIWKLWRYAHRNERVGFAPSEGVERTELLRRACDVEGKLESTLVRLSCERVLGYEDIKAIGQFRQLFQQLREAIFANQDIDWGWSEHPEYVAFKTLATRVALLIVDDGRRPSKEAAAEALLEITSNKWEQYIRGDFRND
jgi:hypothetical protein